MYSEKLLLHICCAPDAVYIAPRLTRNYDVSMYFYNPNIYSEREYDARLNELVFVSEKFKIPLLVGEYNPKLWLKYVNIYGSEPEGGKRCTMCFRYRLTKTAQLTVKLGFRNFCSVLSVSPHKNAEVLNELGEEISEKYNINWLHSDFKKKNGFLYSLKIGNYLNLYRQNYCGCIFSLKTRFSKAVAE